MENRGDLGLDEDDVTEKSKIFGQQLGWALLSLSPSKKTRHSHWGESRKNRFCSVKITKSASTC